MPDIRIPNVDEHTADVFRRAGAVRGLSNAETLKRLTSLYTAVLTSADYEHFAREVLKASDLEPITA